MLCFVISDAKGAATNEGKVGAAVVSGKGFPTAQLIVYKQQTEYLCTADINSSFVWTPQENNYATFYDTQKRAWSLQFASPLDARK